jgi:hypothetical protein
MGLPSDDAPGLALASSAADDSSGLTAASALGRDDEEGGEGLGSGGGGEGSGGGGGGMAEKKLGFRGGGGGGGGGGSGCGGILSSMACGERGEGKYAGHEMKHVGGVRPLEAQITPQRSARPRMVGPRRGSPVSPLPSFARALHA